MLRNLREDITAIFGRDPSIRGFSGLLEIIFTYPGFHALFLHRFAHWLHAKVRFPFVPRLVMSISRFFTGIEIHPGATIGRRCVIDHGMGIVVGETTIIGDDVTMFQGVTIGGAGTETGKRHPTIGNNVTLGANASILGNITIGDHVRVGANSVVIESAPNHSTVIGVPGVVVRFEAEKALEPLSHQQLPDPVLARVHNLFRELLCLIGDDDLEKCRLRDQIVSGAPYDPENCPKECVVCDMTRSFFKEKGQEVTQGKSDVSESK
jgi:serine O-acetyltransferase